MKTRLRLPCSLVLSLWLGACPSNAQEPREVSHGRLETIHGYKVLSLEGTPQEMGIAYGTLLQDTIGRVVKDMITDGIGQGKEAYANIIAGSKVMEQHQPKDYLEEVQAMATAADVAYQDLLLLQYFGDVRRSIEGPGSSSLCTSFAILPPHTEEGLCIVGRNLDYFDNGVGDYASLLVYYQPRGKIPFVTVTWAGIINGWTLLNAKGIVVSNNTSFGGRSNSLEGISTCFLLRAIVERAEHLDQGIEIVQKAARSCGTNLLIASGRPPAAAILEFDHAEITVRKAANGFVGAANSFLKLYDEDPAGEAAYWGRIGTAFSLVQERGKRITLEDNIASADGVPIESMNLHSAMIDATHLRLRLAMGRIPACTLPYKGFRLTDKGLVEDTSEP